MSEEKTAIQKLYEDPKSKNFVNHLIGAYLPINKPTKVWEFEDKKPHKCNVCGHDLIDLGTVLGRMQYSWYRIIDLTFIVLAMYHGLNGIWNIFRDYKMKPWLKYSVISALVIFGIAFTAWGFNIIFSIPYIN